LDQSLLCAGNCRRLFAFFFATFAKLFATFAVKAFLCPDTLYRLSEEVCRSAIRVPFNSKRLSRQT